MQTAQLNEGKIIDIEVSESMLASDTEREKVVERIKQAAIEGRITNEELEARLGDAVNARTLKELNTALQSLPVRVVEPAVELIKPSAGAGLSMATAASLVARTQPITQTTTTTARGERTLDALKLLILVAVVLPILLAITAPTRVLLHQKGENIDQKQNLTLTYKTLKSMNVFYDNGVEEGKISMERAAQKLEELEPQLDVAAASPAEAVEDVIGVSYKDGKYVLSSLSDDGRLHTLTAGKTGGVEVVHED